MAIDWQREIVESYALRKRMNSIHVDLGCGSLPRNPLGAGETVGVDVFAQPLYECVAGSLGYKQVSPGASLPFQNNEIDSVSAFDFLEHIPRTDRSHSGQILNPFISIMNEIHRILKPGGIFISLTPCFPSPAAFTDPTHVNFITAETHLYFSGPNFAKEKSYGFEGEFRIIEATWSDWSGFLWESFATENLNSTISQKPEGNGQFRGFQKKLKQKVRKKFLGHSGQTHFLWVLQKQEYND